MVGFNPLNLESPIAEEVLVNEYVLIKPTGEILIRLHRHEMGQGVSTGLSMLLAEEMDANWESVEVEFADRKPGLVNGTGGSTSTLGSWEPLRKAGAMARQTLVKAAARKWVVDEIDCITDNGKLRHRMSGKEMAFAEALPYVTQPIETNEEVKLKNKNEFKLLGQAMPSKIIPNIVHATYTYGMDVQPEGMKYAVIARSPTMGGRLLGYDASEALNVTGVEKVVTIKGMVVDGNGHVRDGVAVIADNTWAALQGRKKLKIDWEDGPGASIEPKRFMEEAHERLRNKKGNLIFERGELPTESDEGSITRSYTYEFPYQHHACMEPLNATARVSEKACEIWTGTQSADRIVETISKHLQIDPEQIKVHMLPSGGGFGLRYHACYALEVAMVSKAADGDLVKLVYSREDDIQYDYLNPLELNQHRFQIKDGRIQCWDFKVLIDNWGGACSWIFYDVLRVTTQQVNVKGFTQMGAWRSVMGNAEGYSIECAIDELAHELNKDPYAFRLGMLPEGKMENVNHQYPCNINRMRNCLIQVARHTQWKAESGRNGRGRGMALFPYMHGNGYAAAVAAVDMSSGKLKVEKVTIAVDCGLVVNPDQVKQQMEGGVVWALSAMFYGGTDYEKGIVTRSNFHDNRLLRIHQCPEIEVIICENEEDQPWGVGEIAGPVVYPAVCNAIFNATGKRIRKLPLPADMV